MYPNQQRVIHHVLPLQELHVPPQLLGQQRSLLWTKLERPPPINPILVLQNSSRVLLRLLFWVFPSESTSFQVVRLVYISMGREEVVHDHEMDLPSSGKLDSVQTIEPGEKGMRVIFDVCIIVLQDRSEEFMFGMGDGLDDESVISREVEE